MGMRDSDDTELSLTTSQLGSKSKSNSPFTRDLGYCLGTSFHLPESSDISFEEWRRSRALFAPATHSFIPLYAHECRKSAVALTAEATISTGTTSKE